MRRFQSVFAILALLTSPASTTTGQESVDVPVFRVTSKQVVVDFVAIDERGRFVADLRNKDPRLLAEVEEGLRFEKELRQQAQGGAQ